MRRETPLVIGGGLITDIIGTACSLYRRSTSYVRLPTTLIGLIDASVAIDINNKIVILTSTVVFKKSGERAFCLISFLLL